MLSALPHEPLDNVAPSTCSSCRAHDRRVEVDAPAACAATASAAASSAADATSIIRARHHSLTGGGRSGATRPRGHGSSVSMRPHRRLRLLRRRRPSLASCALGSPRCL